MRKIDPKLRIGAETQFAVRDGAVRVPVRTLRRGVGAATILLWITMMMNQVLIGFFTQYMPTMLNSFGLDMASAIRAAGVPARRRAGTLALGWLVDRHGYFVVLATVYFGAFLCAILIVSFGISVAPILIVAFFAGICVSGGQNTINALSGAFYPTLTRSTGSGWGLGIGRIGAVIGIPALGAAAEDRMDGADDLFRGRLGWTLRRNLDPADELAGGAIARNSQNAPRSRRPSRTRRAPLAE